MTTKPKRNKCLVFSRISSEKQHARIESGDDVKGLDGSSFDQQIDACKAYAKQMGFQDIVIHPPVIESAKEEGPEFKKMIAAVKRGKFDAIIVQYLDRFSRKLSVAAKYAEELKKMGIYIHAVSENVNTEDSLFYINLYAIIAEQENLRRSERTVRSSIAKLESGIWIHRAPIGYTKDKNLKKVFLSNDAEFIKAAFKMVAAGSDIKTVRDVMAKQGFSQDYKRWGEILRNPFYAGILRSKYLHSQNMTIRGDQKPLISVSAFNQVQQRLKSKNGIKETQEDDERYYAIKSVLACPECSGGITGYVKEKAGKKYHYYKCSHGCKHNVGVGTVNALFMERLSVLRLKENVEHGLDEKCSSIFQQKFKEELAQQKRLTARISKLRNANERAYKEHLMGDSTREEYNVAKAQILQDIEVAEQALKDLTIVDEDEFIKDIKQLVMNLEQLWNYASVEQRKRVLKIIVKDRFRYLKQENIIDGLAFPDILCEHSKEERVAA